MNRMNRIEPNMSADKYKTYQILQPRGTHFRSATCEEAECQAYQNGWKSVIDTKTELGQKQAYYIRKQSGRKSKETQLPEGLVEFEFEAGQSCFASDKHVVSLNRPGIYVVRDGDHRGNPRGTAARRHANATEWVEDFAEHQDKLKTEMDKGF